MKHQSLPPFTLHIHRSLIALVILGFSLYANESATITVQRGENHKFRGMIAARYHYYGWGEGLSAAIKDSVRKLIYGAEYLNPRVLRFAGRANSWLPGEFKAILSINPNLTILKTTGNVSKLGKPQYEHMAENISYSLEDLRKWRDTYGITCDAVGSYNEPNNHPDAIDNDHYVEFVKMWRDSLDASSFREMKLIAPENSNVGNSPNASGTALVLMNDPSALAALGGIGYHCHDFPMTKWFADTLRNTLAPYNKEVWQTEAGGVDYYETHPYYNAVTLAGNCLAEINLIAEYWGGINDFCLLSDSLYQNYLEGKGGANNMGIVFCRTIAETQTMVLTLKYFYQREISRAFPHNTGMRRCTSDLTPWSGSDALKDANANDTERFTYMYNTQGLRPQLNSACGQDPNGRWGLAVTNQTGIGVQRDTTTWGWIYRHFAPATDYDVTFHVEELVNEGNVEFIVTRCNVNDTVKLENNVTMHNGDVTVTVKSGELVTLKSVEGKTEIRSQRLEVRNQKSGDGMNIQSSGRLARIAFAVPKEYSNENINLALYDTRGRLVQKLVHGMLSAGNHTVLWDRKNGDENITEHGAYLLRLSARGRTLGNKLILN